MKRPKTNATRILERLDIPFEVRTYEVDESDLSAETVAAKVGLPPEAVYKTLLARGDKNGLCLAVIAGNTTLDLKALARATKDRRVEMVPLKDVQPLTGYIRGGVTALGTKKPLPVWVDDPFTTLEAVAVSAGMRGQQLVLKPQDYLKATSAQLAPISRPKT